MGGVLEVIILCLGFFLFPISEFSYLIEAAQSLFYARTFRDDLFQKSQGIKDEDLQYMIKKGVITNMEATEIKNHKKVVLSYHDYFQIFFKRLCLPVFKNRWYNLLSSRDEQLLKLCDIVETKIE